METEPGSERDEGGEVVNTVQEDVAAHVGGFRDYIFSPRTYNNK